MCLGDWFVGKDHFFAVANTKESRKDEKYRCMLKNRDDDYFLGVSITPECNTLKTVEKSPERMRLKPVRSNIVEHSCLLPENFTGTYILFTSSKNQIYEFRIPNIFCCLNENLKTFLYTLTGSTRRQKEKKKVFSFKVYTKV